LLVTVEPFPLGAGAGPVLDQIVAGVLDDQLVRLAQVARSAAPQMVFLRWGQEMEISGLYPWAANQPDLYRAAYHHVVQVFRSVGATNVRWVWSPAGNSEAPDYYPGDDVVDYVGLTVLGDEAWDQGFGLPPQSFAELVGWKYNLVAPMRRPVLITELGVSGTAERQATWLAEVPSALASFPLIRGISYFNDVNAVNSHLSRRPDWRISPTAFAALAEQTRATPWPGLSRPSSP
jgi:endoglucanase